MIKNYIHTNSLRGIKQVLACWLCCILAFSAQAQHGVNDPTFNPNDRGHYFGDGHSWYSENYQTILLPGGKMIILGSSTSYNGVYTVGVQRINSDGSIDTTFHSTGTNSTVTRGAVQADGKLVITGFFTQYNGTAANHLARINVDGSLDTSFHTGTGLNMPGSPYYPGLALQADGKIIVGDLAISNYNGTVIPNMCRINTDGSIDSAYLLNLPANPTTAWGLTVLSNGKLMLAGVQRLNTDGTPDSTYDRGGSINGAAYAIVEQPDHKILLGGTFQNWNGVNVQSILRVDSLGVVDTTFNLGHSNIVYCDDLALQPDGKIMAGGWFDIINGQVVNGIVRLNADGTTDHTFYAGSAIDDIMTYQLAVRSITLLSTGQMVAAGIWYTFDSTSRKSLIKLNADGSIEPTFNRMGSTNSDVLSALIQADGKLLFGGKFDSYQNATEYNIVRTNADGLVDTGFNTHKAINVGSGSGNTGVWAIAQQADGKIVVGGSFYDFNNRGMARLGRFNTNGSPRH